MSAAAVLGTQQNYDQSVIQQAARPKKRQEKHVVQDPNTSVPVILAVASAVGVLLWWKAHKKSSKKGGTGKGKAKA